MKKFILMILIFTGIAFANDYVCRLRDGSYYIRCYKCELKAKTKHQDIGCFGCMAHRDYAAEKGKHPKYMIYRCQTGHVLYVPYDDNEEVK